MTRLKTLALGLVGGVILFVWGFASHAVLPWYDSVYAEFEDETAVAAVLQSNASRDGIHYLPYADSDRSAGEPEAFANVLRTGPRRTMTSKIVLGLTIQVASVLLVVALVGRLAADGYLGRVLQFSLAGFGIAFVSHAYYWNWFEFPTDYIAVTIADTTIAWTLVGLAVAGFVKRTT